jgi:general secretion pathway protein N
MRYAKHVALAVAAYSLALIVIAPATLLDAAVRHASDGMLRVAEARGSIWSGSGELELIDARRRTGIAKTVRWHLLPGALWRGSVAYEVQLADAAIPASVSVSPSRVEIAHASIQLPANAIVIAAPRLAVAQLGGDLSIDAARVVADGNSLRGSATLRWRNARSALTAVSPLGAYELRAESDEAGLHATLVTLEGPLELKGEGAWRRGAPPAFAVIARVAPPHVDAIAPVLRLIASESTDGTFRFVLP